MVAVRLLRFGYVDTKARELLVEVASVRASIAHVHCLLFANILDREEPKWYEY